MSKAITNKDVGKMVKTPDGVGELIYIIPSFDPFVNEVKHIPNDALRVYFENGSDEGGFNFGFYDINQCQLTKIKRKV